MIPERKSNAQISVESSRHGVSGLSVPYDFRPANERWNSKSSSQLQCSGVVRADTSSGKAEVVFVAHSVCRRTKQKGEHEQAR